MLPAMPQARQRDADDTMKSPNV